MFESHDLTNSFDQHSLGLERLRQILVFLSPHLMQLQQPHASLRFQSVNYFLYVLKGTLFTVLFCL